MWRQERKTGTDSGGPHSRSAIVVDPTGRANGRGAYLCGQQSCWQTALSRDSLSRALRTSIDGEALTTLRDFARSLPAEDPGNAEIQKGEDPR